MPGCARARSTWWASGAIAPWPPSSTPTSAWPTGGCARRLGGRTSCSRRREHVEAILTLVEKTALLKALPVYSTIPTEALAQLAARTIERHFDAGDVVIREGEPNRALLIVVEGQLQVTKGGQLARIIDVGMGFGQLELQEGEPHTLTVAALTHAHVLWVGIEELWDSVNDFPEIGIGL